MVASLKLHNRCPFPVKERLNHQKITRLVLASNLCVVTEVENTHVKILITQLIA